MEANFIEKASALQLFVIWIVSCIVKQNELLQLLFVIADYFEAYRTTIWWGKAKNKASTTDIYSL